MEPTTEKTRVNSLWNNQIGSRCHRLMKKQHQDLLPAPAVTPFGKGKGKEEIGDGRLAQMPPLPVLGRASVAASAADAGREGAEDAGSHQGPRDRRDGFNIRHPKDLGGENGKCF